jgi:hypothetical protein
MNLVNIIGKLNAIGRKEDGRQYFGMKTTQTRINDVTEEVEVEDQYISCVAWGRFLNTLDTIKVGHELAIEGRLINLDGDGALSVEVNDIVIL